MRHMLHVTLLRFQLHAGESIFDQVVFAAKKAFVSGEYRPGQVFPSVRSMAAELKIHPNTAHKIIQYLIHEGWLEAHPGIGTVVANPPEARRADRKRLLHQEVEQLVVEAKRVGLQLNEVIEAVASHWSALDKPNDMERRK